MKHIICAGSVSIMALLVGSQGMAQGFDTSGVKINEQLAARVPVHIREAGVLVGGSDNDYAPWQYLSGQDGQTPEGIDIDIGDAIAARLGLTYESRTAQFTTILPSLGTNYDVGLSAFSITPERMEVVNFISYAETGNEWLIRANNPDGFDTRDTCGQQVAVQSGSRHEERLLLVNGDCVAAGKPEMTLLPFRTQTEAVTRVATGGAAATITGSATALYAAFVSDGLLETVTPADARINVRGLNGVAINKADSELTQLIADTINELIQDGTYHAILDAWGMSQIAVAEAIVNPVGEH